MTQRNHSCPCLRWPSWRRGYQRVGGVLLLLTVGLLPFTNEIRALLVLCLPPLQNDAHKATIITSCTVEEDTANYTLEVALFRPSEFREFLSGPGLDTMMKNEGKLVGTMAVCEWNLNSGTDHLPHELEQLLACWSWWNAHRRRDRSNSNNSTNTSNSTVTTPLVLYREKANNRFRPTDLYHKFKKNRQSIHYVQSFVSALQQAFGLQVIESSSPSDDEANQLVVENGSNASLLLQQSVRKRGRGYYMASPLDIQDLKDGVGGVLRIPKRSSCRNTINNNHTPLLPRVAILNRKQSHTRSLLQANEIAQAIQEALQGKIHPNGVPVEYFEGTSFAHQVAFFANTDIVISPHGAQLTSIPFLPTCGAFLEIFPKKYYDQRFYGSLAEATGIKQYTLYVSSSMETAKQDFEKVFREQKNRSTFRNVNLCPSSAKIIEAVAAMVSAWNECCQQTTTVDGEHRL